MLFYIYIYIVNGEPVRRFCVAQVYEQLSFEVSSHRLALFLACPSVLSLKTQVSLEVRMAKLEF